MASISRKKNRLRFLAALHAQARLRLAEPKMRRGSLTLSGKVMVMARNRISGLGITVGSAMLLAIAGACDSGGTTAAPTSTNTGTSTSTNTTTGQGGGGGVSAGTGGAKVTTGTGGAKVTTGTGGAPVSTGVGGSGNTTSASCTGLTPPTASGTLSVAGGYVTSGSLKGYGFTWVGTLSNSTTCITPTCNTTGCTPTFGTSALCAAGVVTADTSYNSVIGIGFNLNQPSTGGTTLGTVSAPSNVTVTATFSGTGAGNAASRIQIVGADGSNYCAAAGSWTSGVATPISTFNTACWDGSGTALTAGTAINAIDIVVPSSGTVDSPFSICLTGVTLQ